MSAHYCCENCRRLRNELAALKDAVQALQECVNGERNDFENVASILNGALKRNKTYENKA